MVSPARFTAVRTASSKLWPEVPTISMDLNTPLIGPLPVPVIRTPRPVRWPGASHVPPRRAQADRRTTLPGATGATIRTIDEDALLREFYRRQSELPCPPPPRDRRPRHSGPSARPFGVGTAFMLQNSGD